ncbi:hypothetical protein E2C01_054008 [Portunus trituberculatus]|uniref:Uncharacterized protein n=1 Tax=Portunus trituberculatus TaxID=210409 RepID=A0A5B7GRL4_PORTR|nr:hypothetical protein [Portunus trituberculatus]
MRECKKYLVFHISSVHNSRESTSSSCQVALVSPSPSPVSHSSRHSTFSVTAERHSRSVLPRNSSLLIPTPHASSPQHLPSTRIKHRLQHQGGPGGRRGGRGGLSEVSRWGSDAAPCGSRVVVPLMNGRRRHLPPLASLPSSITPSLHHSLHLTTAHL